MSVNITSRRVKVVILYQVEWHYDPDVTLTRICRKMSLKLELSLSLQSKYSTVIWGMKGGEYCSLFFNPIIPMQTIILTLLLDLFPLM